jgi:hypothetical protein
MFERIGRLAEKTADGLSRRAFLTRMGLGALALTTFVTGVHAAPVITCIKNGGCCGGFAPYLRLIDGVPNSCCKKAPCNPALLCGCAACSASTCCNGGGYCHGIESKCYKDACSTPC